MGTIKARVNTQYKQLEGMFDLGDEVEIVSVLSTEPRVVFPAQTFFKASVGRHVELIPALIAPIGSFEGFLIKSKNGNTYSDRTLHHALGYIRMEKIFDKL